MSRREDDTLLNQVDILISDARAELEREVRFSRDCGFYYTSAGEVIGDAIDECEHWRYTAAAEYDGEGDDSPEVITPETRAELEKAERDLINVMPQ